MDKRYHCIIIGAGPGGLQAAIHLARYNRRVLLLDRGGGRTRHAVHIENFLGHKLVSGKELVDMGLEQIRQFGVDVEKVRVEKVKKDKDFRVFTKEGEYESPFVIASSGATENLPQIKNMNRFFARSIFTCVDCDGYKTTGKKLLLMGKKIDTVRLAIGMKQMFTPDISLLLINYRPPVEYREALAEEQIKLVLGEPIEFFGDDQLTGLTLGDGTVVDCEAVMLSFGFRLNDDYLSELPLGRDGRGYKISVNHSNESSIPGLFVLGALRTGNAQAVIAAGQGAVAAIEINKRLLEI